jgi:hypothetical protein
MTRRSTPAASSRAPSQSRVSITNAAWIAPDGGPPPPRGWTSRPPTRTDPDSRTSARAGTLDAVRLEPVGEEPPAIGLVDPPPQGRQHVRQRRGAQGHPVTEVAHVVRRPTGCSATGVTCRRRGPRRRSCSRVDVAASTGMVHRHRPLDAIERQPLQHAGEAEAVVAVRVGDRHVVDRRGRDAGAGQLPLGALARVEQDPEPVPAEQVAVVVAFAGRDLAGGPEHDQLPHRGASRRVTLARLARVRRTVSAGARERLATVRSSRYVRASGRGSAGHSARGWCAARTGSRGSAGVATRSRSTAHLWDGPEGGVP